MKNKNKTVFVGLSGGVDSSVAALRLKKSGYDVVGVFIKVWQPEFINCNWEQERLDAMRVAAHLEIPFLTCDAETTYKKDVADYFVSQYQAGRTPNPDVMCNQYVKFGRFLDFAKEKGADYVATGHYVRKVEREVSGKKSYELHRGVDQNKDQSYFLWTLNQSQLAHSLFPVGDTTKADIRDEAMSAKVPVAEKHDSQGICFLGQVDIPDFLSHFIDLQPGDVLDEEGEKIGVHKGALVYTLGQRHGFTITTRITTESAHYVIDRNLEQNTITVSAQKPKVSKNNNQMVITDTNWLPTEPITGETVDLQTRYRQKPMKAVIKSADGNLRQAVLDLPTGVERPALGQSAVLYDGDKCLGGGIIS